MQEKLLLWNLDRDCNFEAGSFRVFYYALESRISYVISGFHCIQFNLFKLNYKLKIIGNKHIKYFMDRRNFTAK